MSSVQKVVCRFKQRRMLPHERGAPAEVVFEVSEGPNKGQRITSRIWKQSLLARVGDLARDAQVCVYLAPSAGGQQGFVKVIDVHAVRKPTVAQTVSAAADGGVPGSGLQRREPGLSVSRYAFEILSADTLGVDPYEDDAYAEDFIELCAEVLQRLRDPDAAGGGDDDGEEDFDLDDYDERFNVRFVVRGGKQGYRNAEPSESLQRAYELATAPGMNSETHISAYQYSQDAIEYQASHKGSIANYRAPVWSRWLTIDLDGENGVEDVLELARIIVAALARLGVPEKSLLVFFSGRRGIHIQFPSTLAGARPRLGFEAVAGHFCQLLADLALLARVPQESRDRRDAVAGFKATPLDWHLYSPNALVRAPNTLHSDSKRFKIRLSLEELLHNSADEIRALAQDIRTYLSPQWRYGACDLLARCWDMAEKIQAARSKRLESLGDGDRLIFQDTLDFIHHGAPAGTRANRLFRAAMNLLDFRCPRSLLFALLGPPAEMSGLSINEIRDQLHGACLRHERQSGGASDIDDDGDELI
jgi:hypothetical protein